MQRAFPSVHVHADRLFAENGSIITGAGSAAGIDLCLHLISCDYGAAVANAAARAAVVTPVRHGGQARFVRTPRPPRSRRAPADVHPRTRTCGRGRPAPRKHRPTMTVAIGVLTYSSERSLVKAALAGLLASGASVAVPHSLIG
ncbi:hypothetical protein ACN6LM_000045 [Streptomyces sp. SAS_281]|uniref:hypothetical protein n=1 Tax=Streptomyces sp. SAS_281 TaxID=3412744 RepID=UPI00403C0319